jgi:hypothetical protein
MKARADAAELLKTLAGLIRLLERADTTDAFRSNLNPLFDFFGQLFHF